MKNKIIYIVSFLFLLAGASCESYSDLIPSNYDKILSIKDVGEKKITLYNTGEDGNYVFTVLKGGNNPKARTEAIVKIMDEVELAEYSNLVGRTYNLLPSNLYEIVSPTLSFESSDMFRNGEIILKTDAIEELLNSDDSNYVLPITIKSEVDSINANKSLVLLQPEVVVPNIDFSVSSATLNITGEGSDYELTLVLPFESLWDFECEVAVDPTSVPANFELIDSDKYTIANNGVIEFKKGSAVSEPLKIHLKNSDVFGSSFVLPIKITKISMDSFTKQETSFLLYGAYNRVPLTVEMLSTNAQEPSEGPIANLIDGNAATYFHSAWSVAVSEAHYFQIKLDNPISMCRYDYQNRNNANGKPQEYKIMVSDNGKDWSELSHITSGLPTGAGSTYSSEQLTHTKPFSYFRLVMYRTNSGSAPTFFSMAEFSLYGK